MSDSGVWTDDKIAQLRELWPEEKGHSTAEIGRIMGMTKNAVVGKAHRLDLPGRASPIRHLAPGETPKPRKPRHSPSPLRTLPALRVVAETPAPEPPPPPPRKSEMRCQWIEGNRRPFTQDCFCNEPVVEDVVIFGRLRRSPWCAAHHARAYMRIPVAEDAAA